MWGHHGKNFENCIVDRSSIYSKRVRDKGSVVEQAGIFEIQSPIRPLYCCSLLEQEGNDGRCCLSLPLLLLFHKLVVLEKAVFFHSQTWYYCCLSNGGGKQAACHCLLQLPWQWVSDQGRPPSRTHSCQTGKSSGVVCNERIGSFKIISNLLPLQRQWRVIFITGICNEQEEINILFASIV